MISQINEPLNTAPCGFVSFTDDGTIVSLNATFLALLEYPLEELTGKKLEFILSIASRIFYQTHFFPLLRIQERVTEVYFSVRTKRGIDLPMLVNAVRRKRAGIFVNDCIFITINQRIQYEDEILQAKKKAESAIAAQQQAEKALRQQYERALLLKEITQQIHQTLDLSQIFEIAVHQIRQTFQVERVVIFKFYPDSSFKVGEFIAESVGAGVNSVMAIKITDSCFAEQYSTIYQQGKIQVVDNIDLAELSDCYREFLVQFQIRANLVVPLLKGGELWGLVGIHQCSSPHQWQAFEIDFIGQIANQLAIAISQADLFEKLQKELSERKQVEAKLRQAIEKLSSATELLEKLANTDELTQIFNRRYFNERLEQEWQRLAREQLPLCLLLFDVDYFKRYNDTYGHQLGDECLRKITHAAQEALYRPADLIARYGGEEFTVILPNTELAGAITVAQRIHQAIHTLNIPHQTSDVSDRVTVSIGIAISVPISNILSVDLIHQADQALYFAKQQGRNRSAIVDAVVSSLKLNKSRRQEKHPTD